LGNRKLAALKTILRSFSRPFGKKVKVWELKIGVGRERRKYVELLG